MYGTAEVILYAGENAVYADEAVDQVTGVECNGWTVKSARLEAERSRLVMNLEGPIPFNIVFMDKPLEVGQVPIERNYPDET